MVHRRNFLSLSTAPFLRLAAGSCSGSDLGHNETAGSRPGPSGLNTVGLRGQISEKVWKCQRRAAAAC